MARLHDFLAGHRRLVLAAWVVALVAAAPFAAKQTDNLTSGGFLVPGSGRPISVCEAIDARYLLEDMFAKLADHAQPSPAPRSAS